MNVTIYTDGACSGNPGPGGYGAILMYGEHKKELSGGNPNTTNNRMELMGVITALKALNRPCQVDLYTDSQYVVNAIEKGCTCPPEFPVCVCGKKPQVKLITRKPIVSGAKELEENPRARSAKLRICEKL